MYPTNNKPCQKGLPLTNALAYLTFSSVTEIKTSKTLTSVVYVKKIPITNKQAK
jgi:hypothetical protein